MDQETPSLPNPPNPGSREAGEQGCRCAVLDNNHGRFPPWGEGGWYITGGCPLHDRRET